MKKAICSLLLGVFILAGVLPIRAQERHKYAATIEMKQGYLSGICVMVSEKDVYRASFFNEFGISALDFTYQPSKRKVKLQHVIKMMDKWYIRRVLKHDLAHVVDNLLQGIPTYTDEKYHIKYQFTLLEDTSESKESDDITDTNDAIEE